MPTLGRFHTLNIVRQTSTDWILDGGELGDVRLSKHDADRPLHTGEAVSVFVYTGEDGYPAASTRQPLLQLNEVASLRVLEAGRQGVWLDMGLAEAVFMPRAEQQKRLEPGWRCVAMLIEDERLGLIATARLNDFLDDEAEGLNPGDAVSLLVAARTDMGWKVVVNHRFWGLLYADEVFESLLIGDRRNGFVKRLRGDRRLDVSLAPPGYAKVDGAADKVLAALRASGGFLPLGDDSSPDEIHAAFGISKKVFKQAIGALFRQQRIVIGEQGIRLVQG